MGAWKGRQDAYGKEIHDFLTRRAGERTEIVERDDGWIDTSSGPAAYFAPYRHWPRHQKSAIRLARGRVLDVGCGAGRVALHLQGKGLAVTSIDNSALAVTVSKSRGVRDVRLVPVTQFNAPPRTFGTIVMFGNNFGLFGSRQRARWLLKRFYRMTTDGARIIAESCDLYKTTTPEHLAYHKLNRRRRRMCGQLRLRIRYRKTATPWFDYLLVSPDEMKDIARGTGWTVRRLFPSGGAAYVAVLEKEVDRRSKKGGAR